MFPPAPLASESFSNLAAWTFLSAIYENIHTGPARMPLTLHYMSLPLYPFVTRTVGTLQPNNSVYSKQGPAQQQHTADKLQWTYKIHTCFLHPARTVNQACSDSLCWLRSTYSQPKDATSIPMHSQALNPMRNNKGQNLKKTRRNLGLSSMHAFQGKNH